MENNEDNQTLMARLRAGIIFRAAVLQRRLSLRRELIESGSPPPAPASAHSYLNSEHSTIESMPSLLTTFANNQTSSSSNLIAQLNDNSSRASVLLPLLPLPDVVLFPNETLPIRLPSTSAVTSYLQAAISLSARDYNTPVFLGIVNSVLGSVEVGEVGTVGEVAQIINNSGDEQDLPLDAVTGTVATLTGARRFRIIKKLDAGEFYGGSDEMIDYRRRFGGVDWCFVRLLPDLVPDKLEDINVVSKKCGLPAFLLRSADVRRKIDYVRDLCDHAVDEDEDEDDDEDKGSHTATATPPPTKKKKKKHANGFSSILPQCPNRNVDPLYFSFWIAANLPISTIERQKLLSLETINQRMAAIMSLMGIKVQPKSEGRGEVKGRLYCGSCGAAIAFKRDVFSVPGAAGCNKAYVNPHGVVHQTVTVRRVENVVVEASLPTLADTWFPGYAWTITYCRVCGDHLGWKFTLVQGSMGAMEAEQREDAVKHFFGIRGSALVEDATDSVGEGDDVNMAEVD
ncbi:hypothetical protein TrVE_jg7584 [Triparma verrucosa]|uniref:Protein cereblon n=1 Tax=Triparma verrucosa TaxID=1606542 RepID=A0A9W7FN25_9STRA|nr:hypothetical protein TrVE_jg7584 [Triparma verrucosa]